MQYFFVLGNNPTLSLAEICSIFPVSTDSKILRNDIFLLDYNNKVDASALIRKMGGTIKIGEIQDVKIKKGDKKTIVTEVIKLLNPTEGKYKYGISYYGDKKFDTKILAMEIKNFLRDKGVSCRWVTSREKNLSSVVVEQNKLTSRGIEIIVIEDGDNVLIGKTLAVQPFKELSFRDYGRPSRDDFSGMLPPKLSQIMINLSKVENDGVLLDPFCGSGTVLTEAMLMGNKKVIGCDISQDAISSTEKNISWIRNNFNLDKIDYKLFNKSATELSKILEHKSIDAVVTEPFLGPQRGHINVNDVARNLEELYSKTLSELFKILKASGTIVMIWPVLCHGGNFRFLNPKIDSFKIVDPVAETLRGNKIIKKTQRNTIIYGREGQKVWREIVVLKIK